MKNKVAIVNRTNLKNFGSVLQVYALCDAVKKLGYDSEVVWQSGNMSQNYDLRPVVILQTEDGAVAECILKNNGFNVFTSVEELEK